MTTPTAFKAWITQPTTVSGIGALAATTVAGIAGILAHQMTHDPSTVAYTSATVGGIVLGAVKMILPDNSAAPSSVEQFTQDAISAALQGHLAAALPQLVTEGLAAFQAVTTPVPPPAAPVPVPVTIVGASAP